MPKCRGCGTDIYFKLTEKGKHQPISLKTGESHFIDCPQARRFKSPPPPQDECLACGSKHVEQLAGKGPHNAAIRCRDCGVHRWLRKAGATT